MIKAASVVTAFAVTSLACATLPDSHAPRGRRELLTPMEYANTDCISAFDAINRLRPAWLRARGPSGISNPNPDHAYLVVDDIRVGDLDELRRIPLALIREMRFLDSGQASVRYGLGFTSGAIVIRTGRR